MPSIDQRPIVLSLDLDQALRLVLLLRAQSAVARNTPDYPQAQSLAEYVEARCAATFGPGFFGSLSEDQPA